MGPSEPELDTGDIKVIKDVTNDIIERALGIPAANVVAHGDVKDDDPLDKEASAIKFAQEDVTPGFEEVDLDSMCSSPDTTENTEGYREDGPPDSLKLPEKPFEDESDKHKTERDTYSDNPPQRLHPDPISRSQSRISNASSKHKISWGHVDNMSGLTLTLPNNNVVDDKADDRSRKQSQLSNVSNVSSPSLVSIAVSAVTSVSTLLWVFSLVRVPDQRAAICVGGVASGRLPGQAQQEGSHVCPLWPPLRMPGQCFIPNTLLTSPALLLKDQ